MTSTIDRKHSGRVTVLNAICAVAAAVAVATSLTVAGSRLADDGKTVADIALIVLNVAMLLLMFFVAWNTGRASVRRDNYKEPSAPIGGNNGGEPRDPVVA